MIIDTVKETIQGLFDRTSTREEANTLYEDLNQFMSVCWSNKLAKFKEEEWNGNKVERSQAGSNK